MDFISFSVVKSVLLVKLQEVRVIVIILYVVLGNVRASPFSIQLSARTPINSLQRK
jgi:hypothetical protein